MTYIICSNKWHLSKAHFHVKHAFTCGDHHRSR